MGCTQYATCYVLLCRSELLFTLVSPTLKWLFKLLHIVELCVYQDGCFWLKSDVILTVMLLLQY
jgi:hypothetical protein